MSRADCLEADGQIPPSTIAAQILQNSAVASQQTSPLQREAFDKLLAEFLADPFVDTGEDKLPDNARFITFLLEAATESRAAREPFAPQESEKYATDCLKAVGMTIERQPELLLFNGSDARLDGEQPPFLLCLLIKVLLIASKERLNDVWHQLSNLLSTCFWSLWSKPPLWRIARLFEQTLIAMGQEFLQTISSHEPKFQSVHAQVSMTFPSYSVMTLLWKSNQQSITIPLSIQFILHKLSEAGNSLLVVLLTLSQSIKRKAQSSQQSLTVVLLNICEKLLDSLVSRARVFLDRRRMVSALAKVLSAIFEHADNQTHLQRCLNLSSQVVMLMRPADGLQVQLFLSYIILKSTTIPQLNCDFLEQALVILRHSTEYWEDLCQDFRTASKVLLVDIEGAPPSGDHMPTNSESSAESFSDQPLREYAEKIRYSSKNSQHRSDISQNHQVSFASRHSLLDDDSAMVVYASLVLQIAKIFGLNHERFKDMPDVTLLTQKLEEAQILLLLRAMCHIPCAGASTIHGEMVGKQVVCCTTCDLVSNPTEQPHTSWNKKSTAEECKAFYIILKATLDSDIFKSSRESRILAAQVIARFINHMTNEKYLDLAVGYLGRWCMKSFQSSVRELRIVSLRAICAYLMPYRPIDIKVRNMSNMLELLRQLSSRESLALQETIVYAWSQIGRFCGETELNIALIELINFLGHPHMVISGFAYHELYELAAYHQQSVAELLAPYWPSVAPEIVKDIISCPQKAQQVSDLLHLQAGVDELLLLTQSETVPFLVLTRRHDILHRIAQARRDITSVEGLIMQPRRNLACVLSALLLDSSSADGAPSSLLYEAAPNLKGKFTELVQVDPIDTACEILKASSRTEHSLQPKIHQAFDLLARIVKPRFSSTQVTEPMAVFIENYILGIMAHFTDIVDNTKERQTLQEKRRALAAIQQLILCSKELIELALPQVRATLQSAMEKPELTNEAFSAWIALISNIEDDTSKELISHTLSIIIQKWNDFDTFTQTRTHDLVNQFVKRYNTELINNVAALPTMSGIPVFAKLEDELARHKQKLDAGKRLSAYVHRCLDDNVMVVRQALAELEPFLLEFQDYIHESAFGQQPLPSIPAIYRALLDASIRFKEQDNDLLDICARCLGILGCVDPNQVESVRVKHAVMVASNFTRLPEVVDFISNMLQNILVPAFRSAPTGKQQSYLAYVMQELLKISGMADVLISRNRGAASRHALQCWSKFPESIQNTLTPYLDSKYYLANPTLGSNLQPFPDTGPTPPHAFWLRNFVFNLLHRPKGEIASVLFPKISRVIQNHNLSIATFMLPFVIQNVVAGGTDAEIEFIAGEMSSIMAYNIDGPDQMEADNVRQCSEVFDYLSRWVHEKNELVMKIGSRGRNASIPHDVDETEEILQISRARMVLEAVPAEVIAKRAAQCGSYARAVYHYEQYIRETTEKKSGEEVDFEAELNHMQQIYEQIDEPDAIEGISSKLRLLEISQQVLDHKLAGRWTAALTYYESAFQEDPQNPRVQLDLFHCLKSAGQYDSIINTYDKLSTKSDSAPTYLPFAIEAVWTTERWDVLDKLLLGVRSADFNIGLGRAILAIRTNKVEDFRSLMSDMRLTVTRAMTATNTASISVSHSQLLRLHILHEMETLSGFATSGRDIATISNTLNSRLDILGSFTDDKQYILGLRRAVMAVSQLAFDGRDVSSTWLTSSRLARKANQVNSAYDAVTRASRLGDPAATIEHARLLWLSGNARKAAQNLRSAIADGSFASDAPAVGGSLPISVLGPGSRNRSVPQSMLLAKTQLLLAKWMDRSGQEKSDVVLAYYKESANYYNKWDKGHYYLGLYYHKILDSEKSAPMDRHSDNFLSGECTKLTIDNYLRSMLFGPKYLYRTLPKVLTTWLDFASDHHSRLLKAAGLRGRTNRGKGLDSAEYLEKRAKNLGLINQQIEKYLIKRTPSYITYTALAQLLTRIDILQVSTQKVLKDLVVHVAAAHPRQTLWSILAVGRSGNAPKATQARLITQSISQHKSDNGDLKMLVRSAQTLTDALLEVCVKPVSSKGVISLVKDIHFHRRLDEPCGIVVPFQKTLTATLASVPGVQAMRKNNAFPHEYITIAGFLEEVIVLSSLQKPRKLIIRGADGHKYPILCKPKDDLRKDQRLMEFNAMIDRTLKRDVNAAKRKLYIHTYAVTTLNDEHGVLEWVDGLKPLRDVILHNLRRKNVSINFGEIKALLEKASADQTNGHLLFTEKLMSQYPPLLYQWFLESFLEPETWFDARLRYSRSCAVMSIVGHALGLGDRHGENISLEQGNGGVFHVDFNCLFEKGLTFEKPEVVPFRLTHNMIDAFGVYGYEGPFRKAAEITQRLLKSSEDTLMTIMETFIYDPTTDFGLQTGRRTPGVPDTPEEVLLNVRSKFNCLLHGETVRLSVEGYVDVLIKAAINPRNLVKMYVGWCAFL